MTWRLLKVFPDYVISAGATVRQSNVNVSFGQEYVNISLMGVHPNYTEVETVKTADGRFVNQNDLKEHRKVIVIHKRLPIFYLAKLIPNLSGSLSMQVE